MPPVRPRSRASVDAGGKKASTLHSYGEPMVWLTGGALGVSLFMIIGLLVLVVIQGVVTFWPGELVRFESRDGKVYLGEVVRAESYLPQKTTLATLPEVELEFIRKETEANAGKLGRQLIRIGNYEITNEHFVWVNDYQLEALTRPEMGGAGRAHGLGAVLRRADTIPRRRQGCGRYCRDRVAEILRAPRRFA